MEDESNYFYLNFVTWKLFLSKFLLCAIIRSFRANFISNFQRRKIVKVPTIFVKFSVRGRALRERGLFREKIWKNDSKPCLHFKKILNLYLVCGRLKKIIINTFLFLLGGLRILYFVFHLKNKIYTY